MSQPFIADMRHFVEAVEPEGKVSRARARVRHFLGGIVEAATLATPGVAKDTTLACRRRPGRKPCGSNLQVQLTEVPARIVWECVGCGDCGTITHWQGTPWDLSGRRREAREAPVEILLTTDEYEGLQQVGIFDDASQALVRAAQPLPDGVLLTGLRDELEDLAGFVSAEASHKKRNANRETLRGIAGKIQEQIGPLEF